MNEALQQELRKVDSSYKNRKDEVEKVWEGFDREIDGLNLIVFQEFARVLEEIELPENAEIKAFEVDYNLQLRKFKIEIKEWGVEKKGESFSDRRGGYVGSGYCAHCYLEPIIAHGDKADSKIKEFKKEFNVNYISYWCRCGRNHK